MQPRFHPCSKTMVNAGILDVPYTFRQSGIFLGECLDMWLSWWYHVWRQLFNDMSNAHLLDSTIQSLIRTHFGISVELAWLTSTVTLWNAKSSIVCLCLVGMTIFVMFSLVTWFSLIVLVKVPCWLTRNDMSNGTFVKRNHGDLNHHCLLCVQHGAQKVIIFATCRLLQSRTHMTTVSWCSDIQSAGHSCRSHAQNAIDTHPLASRRPV